MPLPDDTIAAIATPPGEGGVGIVRVCGPSAFAIADRVFRGRGEPASALPSHSIHYGVLADPASGDHLDDALALLFHAPRSYTGEDTVEFSCHGGPVTLGRVLDAVLRSGARAARPGEFTERAFLNGRLDLAQAEAVCDLIRARTDAAQRIAIRQHEGQLSREVGRLRSDLLGVLAAVEASIDFSDEIGDLDYDAAVGRLAAASGGIEALLSTAAAGRAIREGLRLVIAGRPNVGKSSLMNAMVRADRAIVTPVPGTTRDVIEQDTSIGGVPVTVVDTAGLRDTADEVERLGVDRTRASLEAASLVVLVADAPAGWTGDDVRLAEHAPPGRTIWVLNKADLVTPEGAEALSRLAPRREPAEPTIALSALGGQGIAALEEAVVELALGGAAPAAEHAVVANARHVEALREALEALARARATLSDRLPADLVTVDVRGALDALGLITGETAPDELIHRIFADFCIGK